MARRRQSPPQAEKPMSARQVPGTGESGRPTLHRAPARHGRSDNSADGHRQARVSHGGAPEAETQPTGVGPNHAPGNTTTSLVVITSSKRALNRSVFNSRPGYAVIALTRFARSSQYSPQRTFALPFLLVTTSCSSARWKAGQALANPDSYSQPAPCGGSDGITTFHTTEGEEVGLAGLVHYCRCSLRGALP